MRVAAGLLLGAALAACRGAPADAPLDALVARILQEDRIPAAVVVAGEGDRILYRKAFGEARPDTVFDLASVTKVVATTTAAMMLVEEGRLALDRPVGEFLAALAGRPVTVRDLLAHRSGLPAYLTPRRRSPESILEEIAVLPVRREKPVYS